MMHACVAAALLQGYFAPEVLALPLKVSQHLPSSGC
jgi:hypothetical protein